MADGESRPGPGAGFTLLRKGSAAPIRIVFEGTEIPAVPGQSVAAALLAAGIFRFRSTPVAAAPRGAYCMMGVCFDCLLVVDGVPNTQACMTQVRDGMRVEAQDGAPDPAGTSSQGESEAP